MARDEKLNKKLDQALVEVKRIVAAESKRRQESGQSTAENGGPDCALCADEDWWKEEFGSAWQWARCETCGPAGWDCPGDFCSA
jgi:hypothetical protein